MTTRYVMLMTSASGFSLFLLLPNVISCRWPRTGTVDGIVHGTLSRNYWSWECAGTILCKTRSQSVISMNQGVCVIAKRHKILQILPMHQDPISKFDIKKRKFIRQIPPFLWNSVATVTDIKYLYLGGYVTDDHWVLIPSSMTCHKT